MVSILKSGGILAMTLGWSASALATTYYVDNKLDDYAGHDGSSWEKAFQRIQDAVAKAANDDIVLVAPGTYGDDQGVVVDKDSGAGSNVNYSYIPNRIWIDNKHITLKSSEGAAVTHIVGAHSTDTATGVGTNAVRCISMSGDSNIGGTRIEGFTLRDGGTLAYNAGFTIKKDGTPTTTACAAAHRGGAALFNYLTNGNESQIHIVDCVISNCVAAEGAAVYGASLIRTKVFDNWTDRARGATVVQGSAYNCVFARNGRVANEGTMLKADNSRPMMIVNCTFFNNQGMILAPSANSKKQAGVFNCLFQCNGGTEVSEGDAITNCIADVKSVTDVGANNVASTTRAQAAIMVAPIFDDFRPVAETYSAVKKPFGKGAKSYCTQSWIPVGDQSKDLAGAARWDADEKVTVGAYQDGVAMAGGCLTVTFAYGKYLIDGKDVRGPSNGYFYSPTPLSQYRFKFVPNEGEEIGHVWLGGYKDSWRYPDMNGELVVTAPPKSTDSMMCVEAKKVTRTYWADANYAGDDSDGTEEKPFKTLQDAVLDVPTVNCYYLVKVKPGSYDQGTAYFWGLSRVKFAQRNICMRSTGGLDKTFIVGADGENADPDGCGTNAVRCVSVDSTSSRYVGLVGFTLTGGRTWNNHMVDGTQNNCRNGGGFFSTGQVAAQAVDCVISNCVAVRGSATYKGMFDNCRIFDNRQAKSPAGETEIESVRGVVWQSYLTGSVIGPNKFSTVCVDQSCKLFNCTVYETQGTQPFSADGDYYNVLELGATYQPKMKQAFEGVAIYSTTFDNIQPGTNYIQLTTAPIVNHLAGDFRPLAGSPILGAGVMPSTNEFVVLTGGGFHKDLLIRDGRVTIGADGDAATPVTLTSAKGITVSGDLDAGYASANFPLTLTATLTDRDFYGFKVNGEQVTEARTLTLTPTADVAAYSVEPLYEKLGAIMLLR